MYRRIDEHRSVRKLYIESLVKRGDITLEEAEQAMDDFHGKLQAALDATRDAGGRAPHEPGARHVVGVQPPSDTSVDRSRLDEITDALAVVPDGLHRHPKLDKQFEARDAMYAERRGRLGARRGVSPSAACWPRASRSASPARTPAAARSRIATRRSSTTRPARSTARSSPIADASGANLWIYDSLLSEYAALGLRVRLLGDATRRRS